MCGRFEALAAKAWFTRKLSVLCPMAGMEPEAFTSSLQLQRWCYELNEVPLTSLCDAAFAEAVSRREICCLSRATRGLDAGNSIAIFPNCLVAALEGGAYERLGLDALCPGARQLRPRPKGRRHVRIGLGISKTRAKQAREMATVPVSRWHTLVPSGETCAMRVAAGGPAMAAEDFQQLLGPGLQATRRDVPTEMRRCRLGALGRLPMEDLVWRPELWTDYGTVCEDLLDYVGALHMGLDPAAVCPLGLGDIEGPSGSEDVLLWSMGESLLAPSQVLHALRLCREALESNALQWFLLSMWGDEDAPLSHHGGAHDFDVTGANHAHLLLVRRPGESEVKGLLLEMANALHSSDKH